MKKSIHEIIGALKGRLTSEELGEIAGAFDRMKEELESETSARDSLARGLEEFRRAERLVNTAFDSIYDPFVIIDREYRIVRANEAYAAMRCIPLEALAGRKCHEVLYGESAACEKCIAGITFLSGDPCADQKNIALQSGFQAWYELYAYPITEKDGSVSHVIEYFHDITDRQLAERAAKLAYLELDQIFNTAADGMCVIDRDFSVLRLNQTFLSMFGLNAAEAIGRKCYDLFPSSQCNTPDCPLTLIVSGRKLMLQFDCEKVSRDGRRFPCTIYATAFRGQDGEVLGIVEDFKDISDRKRLEDELRSLSLTDELTGLYNRRGFFALATHELKMADRHGKKVYLLFADLDGFKAVNDTLGHKEGDRVLKEAAGILRTTFRNSDIIARLGGDEFVVVPIGTAQDNVEAVTGRLQRNIDRFNSGSALKCSISMSVGLACYDPEAPGSIDELLAQADASMYEQKKRKK